MSSRLVVVAIPVYKPRPDPHEEISYRRAVEVLSAHPIALVAPEGLDLGYYTAIYDKVLIERFPSSFFTSQKAYNRLVLSLRYYNRFRSFQHLLAHQLDAFVFRDELEEWCRAPYDFIGAPWVPRRGKADSEVTFLGVGNGGFSLRRIAAVRRVLWRFSVLRPPAEILGQYLARDWPERIRGLPNLIRCILLGNNSFWLLNDKTTAADRFFGIYAARNFEWFRVAPPEVALRFSFETAPRRLFQMAGGKLPFGCHAWQRYDPEFWKAHIPALQQHGTAESHS